MAKEEDSDMEGWEDDGWGTFDSTPQQQQDLTRPPQQEISSGADFFDNFGGSSDSKRTKPKDPFEEFGFSSAKPSSKKDRTPPPMTSASLFGGGDSGSQAGARGGTSTSSEGGGGGGGGGWGDDDEGGGWGDHGGGWGAWDEDVKPSDRVCVEWLAVHVCSS